MQPNLGAVLVIVLGLVLVYVAIKGSQAPFFAAVFGTKSAKPKTSSTSSAAGTTALA